jgi:membrane protein
MQSNSDSLRESLSDRFRQIRRYIQTDIWRHRRRDLSGWKAFSIKYLRILVLTVSGFIKDRCMLRASALTFYALLSIGPLIALALGIAKGFGLQRRLETEVLAKIPAQEEVLNQITSYAKILLENTQGGVIAAVGIVLLIWSALKVFNHLEMTFNDIWRLRESRSWRRIISNYLAFMVLAPFVLLIYSSIPAFITSQIENLAERLALFATIGPVLLMLIGLLPYVLVGAVFTLIYLLIPNTRVRFGAAAAAGIVTGVLYLLVQGALITFQVGITRYNPIYGSLAALPLLLLWMHFGWIILLVGAELSYAVQNVDRYEYRPDFADISPYFRRVLTLQVLHRIATQFVQGEPPLNAGQISALLEIPIRRVQEIVEHLQQSGLLSAVMVSEDADEDPAYQPASDVHRWTISFVNHAIDHRGVEEIPATRTETRRAIEAAFDKLGRAQRESEGNINLLDL